MEDPLLSDVYKNLRNNVVIDNGKTIAIYLQVCWDGAPISNIVQRDSMWPVVYSIINFPPSLRNKLHLGLHVAAFDNGNDSPLEMFAKELLSLYENPIEFNGIKYLVIVSQIVMDGPGRSSFCKLLGHAALKGGCNLCDFKGLTI